jgi:hypothetical protein
MANFCYFTGSDHQESFHHCNTLKRLYIVHPDDHTILILPEELKKLVVHCPKSSDCIINRTKAGWDGLMIRVNECHALEEV